MEIPPLAVDFPRLLRRDTHIGAGTADSIPRGVLESVRFLLENLARRGRPATEGTLVSTGAVTGVHRVHVGAKSVCSFSGVGEIHCTVVRAEA